MNSDEKNHIARMRNMVQRQTGEYVSHGSPRGLIAIAPTGAVGCEAGELGARIANNVAKLLEAAI